FRTYRAAYRVISRANRILDNIERLPESSLRNNIEGEALALRAILHFDIARVYCKIPTQSTDAKQSLGIYYSKQFDPNALNRRVGTTVDQVYLNVIADLERAYSLVNANNGIGRLNKSAIAGLLSRVYLYYGNYPKVVEYADIAIPAGSS
ncbi:RagB/SusD family nutrient uptake outer membrane protein, partial [Desulfonatronum sp. SC1]|uniref:RagB/SusD family nutrient uptake outer membrane protein n=1 Tax=Desulfonatronum sp. SC1 TaxID=2109626 RepID=UPI000D4E8A43